MRANGSFERLSSGRKRPSITFYILGMLGLYLTSSQTDDRSGSIQVHPRLSWLPPFVGLPDVFMLLRALSFRCSESQGPKVIKNDATQAISDFSHYQCLMPSS